MPSVVVRLVSLVSGLSWASVRIRTEAVMRMRSSKSGDRDEKARIHQGCSLFFGSKGFSEGRELEAGGGHDRGNSIQLD